MTSHLEQGIQFEEEERYQEAVAEYTLAALEEPENPAPLIRKGALLNELGEYELALQPLNDALQIDGGDLFALSVRGDVYSSLKRYEEAIADFSAVIAFDPYDVDAFYNRGLAYANVQIPLQLKSQHFPC